MRWRLFTLHTILACLLGAWSATAQPPRGSGRVSGEKRPQESATVQADVDAATPAFDTVIMANGNRVRGHVLTHTANRCELYVPGKRGSYIKSTLNAARIAEIRYAPAAARTAMRQKIDWWLTKSQRDTAGKSRYTVETLTNWYGSPKAWRARGTYYTVETDLSAGSAREFVWRLDLVYPEYCRVWDRSPSTLPPTTAYVFATHERFAKAVLAAGESPALAHRGGGFFSPKLNQIFFDTGVGKARDQRKQFEADAARDPSAWRVSRVTWAKGRERAPMNWTIDILYHEAYHAFVNREIRERGKNPYHPMWMSEGFAVYFSKSRMEEDGLRVGVLHKPTLKKVRGLIARKAIIPLRELVTKPFDSHGRSVYPDSWALVYYLEATGIVRRNGGWLEIPGKRGPEVAATLERMAGKSLEELDKDWHVYMRNLPL